MSLQLRSLAKLQDVTLVTVTGVNVDAAHAALQRSMAQLEFARVLLIASEPPSNPDPNIEWIPIPPMTLREYNRYILQDLFRHIETSHALIVQPDGFVINPDRWNPSWLAFDYLGAPWPPEIVVGPYKLQLRSRVGNGGFSLRSRRLLELTSPIDFQTIRFPSRAEDVIICHLLHDYLVARGIRFADPETAACFSIETDSASFGQTLNTSFGFHGLKNLAALSALEPYQLSPA